MSTQSFLSRTLSKTRYEASNRRGLSFELSLFDVLHLVDTQKGKCALTGWSLEFTRGGNFKGGTNPRGCTIDRLDNAKGYHKDNVQLVCWMANLIRGSLSLLEFKELCEAVTSTQNSLQ